MISKEKVFLILTPGFPASSADTSCLPMQQAFVRSISKMFPEIKIIVLSFQYPFFERTYKLFGVEIKSFNGRNKGGLSKLFLRRKINKTLQGIHRKTQIIGLLSFWLGECAFVGKKFAERNQLKHYCWLLGQDARANNKYVNNLSLQENELIALSDFLQEEFQKNYGLKPFAVIPPGIEQKISNETSRDIDLLAVGSLIPLKRFEIFIEAVASIKGQLPQVKAVLAGTGSEEKKLKNLVAKFDVENTITLAGKLDHEEVLAMMQRTKILLHPSSYEGFSGVCQEALSNGAHVISFCRAMNSNIQQWHIVNSKKEMFQKALALLKDPAVNYNPVPFQSMDAVAQQMMAHF